MVHGASPSGSLQTPDLVLLESAVELAVDSARNGGGPFGAIVAKDGKVVSQGTNRVTASHDPTAHAEMMAIRIASARLASHSLEGCHLYASCEPCPMCLAACLWARIDLIIFAATSEDAAAAGFDDHVMYGELCQHRDQLGRQLVHAKLESGLRPFRAWTANPQRVPY